MLTLQRYDARHKELWNRFVAESKNGLFLFDRDYMDYHADRFADASLLFFEDDRLVAIMPANVRDRTLVSHGGLTFGGIVSDRTMKASKMMELFEELIRHLRAAEFTSIVYKAIPHIYHDVPAEEDLYALFRNGARLVKREVSSCVLTQNPIPPNGSRRQRVRKAEAGGLRPRRTDDFEAFMAMGETALLSRHGVRPVHTADEIKLLASRFPENIKLFVTEKKGILLAGSIIYESRHVVHTQYIFATDEGRQLGATDVILEFLIRDCSKDKRCFDFGISTERGGTYLNEGLAAFKESFGARTVVYDTYEIAL